MKVMVFVQIEPKDETGEMPSEELLAAMSAYNEELVKAGVMLDLGGLKATSECARVEFMRRCGMTDIRQPRGIGVILQHVQCRFRRPIVFPDTVTITARVTSIEADRFTLDHEIISAALNQVAALGTSTIVTYDYTASAKAPIPADLRRAIEALRA